MDYTLVEFFLVALSEQSSRCIQWTFSFSSHVHCRGREAVPTLKGAENVCFRRGTGSCTCCTCWTGRGPPGEEAKFSAGQDCPWDRDMLLFSSSRFWDTNWDSIFEGGLKLSNIRDSFSCSMGLAAASWSLKLWSDIGSCWSSSSGVSSNLGDGCFPSKFNPCWQPTQLDWDNHALCGCRLEEALVKWEALWTSFERGCWDRFCNFTVDGEWCSSFLQGGLEGV